MTAQLSHAKYSTVLFIDFSPYVTQNPRVTICYEQHSGRHFQLDSTFRAVRFGESRSQLQK